MQVLRIGLHKICPIYYNNNYNYLSTYIRPLRIAHSIFYIWENAFFEGAPAPVAYIIIYIISLSFLFLLFSFYSLVRGGLGERDLSHFSLLIFLFSLSLQSGFLRSPVLSAVHRTINDNIARKSRLASTRQPFHQKACIAGRYPCPR